VAEIRAEMPARVTVEFSMPVNGEMPAVPGVTLISRSPQSSVLDIRGPLGPWLAAMRDMPVHDIRVEPFGLEQYVLQFSSGEEAS
jgi:hypothetical protein